MKRVWGMLAMAAVCGLVGCQSTDGWNTADNQTGMHDNANMSARNTMDNNNMNDVAHSNSGAEAAGKTTDQLRAVSNAPQGDTTQLRHGNEKTTVAVALNTQDRTFLQDAASGGMYEVQSSEKAVQKSNDDRVKMIAKNMIDDHTKANRELKALAQRKGVEVSTLPNADQVKMLARLDQLNGEEFDREYLSQQRTAHQDTIAKFQSEVNAGMDRDTKDWAAKTLPVLQDHLKMINGDNNTNIGSNKE